MRCLANGREPGRQVVVLLVRCVSGRAKAGRAAASSADLLSFLWPFLLLLLLLLLLIAVAFAMAFDCLAACQAENGRVSNEPYNKHGGRAVLLRNSCAPLVS